MSQSTEKYRNPPAPVGYTYKKKMKPDRAPHNNISYLLHLKSNLDFMNDDEDLDIDLHHFRIMTSDEESSDEEIKKDSSVKKEPEINKDDAKKEDAVSSHKSENTSPKKKRRKLHEKGRSKGIKKERRYSDSSSDSSHYSSRRNNRYSRSPSPVKIKEEEKVPLHLFGSYHCDVCNITMNSLATFNSHTSGKKHSKALKARNIVDTVARSVPTAAENKKPQPATGVIRVKVKGKAIIQDFIDANMTNPCPGQHHVTEIQGFTETSYFCSMCDVQCGANSILPHLKGFKHRLKCLKHYKLEVYERFKMKQKYQIEDALKDILKGIVRREGTGRITVEEEKLSATMDPNHEEECPRVSLSSRPGTSASQTDFMDFQEYYDQTTIPDKSKSGYYCKICESHMNNSDMWENHVRGKRHLANAKKVPGTLPSKIKTVPMKNVRPHLIDLLEEVDCPVVGLSHIRETQNHQTRKDIYLCYLCGACHTSSDIVEHLISQKHRMKFLQEIQHDCLHVVKDMDINGPNAFSIVEDVCASIEDEQGRGEPSVFFTK